jgi:alkyl hydroperoxide reductase subunit AhpC
MESILIKESKTVKIDFPIVADESLSVSKKYGMIHPESNTIRDLRGVFIIDPNNIVKASVFYDPSFLCCKHSCSASFFWIILSPAIIER